MDFNMKTFNEVIKNMRKTQEEDFKRAKEEEKEGREYSKEFQRKINEAHKEGSVHIDKEKFMNFQEYEDYLLQYFDKEHCYIVPGLTYGLPMHGNGIRSLYLSFYKDFIIHRYKNQLKLFDNGF